MMKKFIILFLLTTLLAIACALYFPMGAAYVVIALPKLQIGVPLWLMILLVLFSFILLHELINFFTNVMSLPSALKGWREKRIYKNEQKHLLKLCHFISREQWIEAERFMTHLSTAMPSLKNYLLTAYCSLQAHHHERAFHYLHVARKTLPRAKICLLLAEAKFAEKIADVPRIFHCLQEILSDRPKLKIAVKLWVENCFHFHRWDKLAELLTLHPKGLSQQDFIRATTQIAIQRIPTITVSNELMNYWKELPKACRANNELLSAYVKKQLSFGETKYAEKLLRTMIDRQDHFSHELILLYASIDDVKLEEQIHYAEKWLERTPKDDVLLKALGYLCMRHRYWGKAKDYFEQSLVINPHQPAVYYALAQVFEGMRDGNAAIRCYREGLKVAAGGCT